MIRYIVLSNTFQQSTTASEEGNEVDPTNRLLHHFPVRRLEGEAIRDGILAVSGRLDTTQFGRSFPTHLTPFMKGRGRPPQSGPVDGYGRRSIYQAMWRNFLPSMMLTFDMPVPFTTFGKRNVSNVPAQSLTMMNDSLVIQQSEFWANRLITEKLPIGERLGLIYKTAFARKPTKKELKTAREFLKEQQKLYGIKEENIDDNLLIWKDFFKIREKGHSLHEKKGLLVVGVHKSSKSQVLRESFSFPLVSASKAALKKERPFFKKKRGIKAANLGLARIPKY